ncbi:DUF6515 family protein [Pseudomonas alkylphenolica]|uniref:DUF6515 family protein n=1 Tax=Pseudomonas alkylphenolica TaxID=237609 RepID=UPI00315CBFFA
MKSRSWCLAGAGLLCITINLQALAEGQGGSGDGYGGQGAEQSQGASPLQSRPDEVRQTQPPRTGYYQDIPRHNNGNRYYQAGGPQQRPQEDNWPGRPDGHGNGWGSGPRYRPGQVVEQFPDQYWRVPYRGGDYFYSGGYWYRPQGPRYVVVAPHYGMRVGYLPDYAREVWVADSLYFLVAGTYYQYLQDSNEYVVVNPPVASAEPQPMENDYDVVANPVSGQSPEQADRDRYECHRWAVQQSGFDPAKATYAPAIQVTDSYRQALRACLSGRGYSVN